MGKIKGSEYLPNQLAKRERGLKENRDEEINRILYDQDAIEKERQLLMNKVDEYNTNEKQIGKRKEIPPNLLSRHKSMPDISPLDLKAQGKEFLRQEQDHKARHFTLNTNREAPSSSRTLVPMNHSNYRAEPVQKRALKTTPSVVPNPYPMYK